MKVSVHGERVSDNIVNTYVQELVKAHPDKNISAVDIIVEGDSLKVRMMHELDKTAWKGERDNAQDNKAWCAEQTALR